MKRIGSGTVPRQGRGWFGGTAVFPMLWMLATAWCAAALAGKTAGNGHNGIPPEQLAAAVTSGCPDEGLALGEDGQGGLRLRCDLQRLAGRVGAGGLWIESTAEGPEGGGGFGLEADYLGRDGGAMVALPEQGRLGSATGLGWRERPGLREEYRVSADGIRQDFIVPAPPAGRGWLRLSLRLEGAELEETDGGRNTGPVRLRLTEGGRRLAYGRLRVTDASGRELPAWFERVNARRLAVVVDDDGARYPVRIDPTFSDADWLVFGPSVRYLYGWGVVYDIVYDPLSGSLYVGGSFWGAVAKWDGSSWSALGSGLDGVVWALAIDGEGNLYACGLFTTAGGVSANRVAKWDGSSWSALGSGMDGEVWALAVDASGNLYAGGDFTSAGGVSANYIAKWDGSNWSALGSGVDHGRYGTVSALAIDADGNLYAGGSFTTAGGVSANHIAK